MDVVSTGMACCVGLGAEAACAAMRAGISMFEELPYFDNSGEPIVGTVLPDLKPGLRGSERLVEILSLAVSDCLADGQHEPSSVALLVGLAEPKRPGGGGELAETIVGTVQQKLGVRFHPHWSRAFARGHTAGFEALGAARELLRQERVGACLICGVDSYINANSLAWLERHWRLKTPDNSDGVIPGEAAAAVLLQNLGAAQDSTADAVRVTGLGFAKESVDVFSEEPLLGLGLTEAARAALGEAGLEFHEIDLRLSDVTGEHYGFKEQALMLARLMRQRREEFPIWHCADSIGDTGAAAGICQLVMAFHAFRKRAATADRVICFTSAVPGDRAVVVLERQAA
jgi:3-oxoacyl-[acyl-carrier-protein] synthase I